MVRFSELFRETNGEPIQYKGKTLLMADEIPVEKNFKAEIDLISVNSKWRQGISLYTKGAIEVGLGHNLVGEDHILWEELWTEMDLGPIEIKGTSKNGTLMVYNSWDWDGCQESWVCNGAMIKEEIGKNEYVYYCNDREWDDDFDDIIFRVKILEGAKEERR